MKKTKLTWLLILINLIGFIFGIYYYLPQLSQNNFLSWVLIIDCPLFALLFALILLFDIKNAFFNFFVSTGLIKYGAWTVFVILLLWDQFILISAMYPYLLIAHFFMIFEFIFLLPQLKITKKNYLVVPLFLFNDYADYIWGLHPWLPSGAPIDLIMQTSVLGSSLIPVVLTMLTLLYHKDLEKAWELESLLTSKKVCATCARKKQRSGKSLTQKRKKFLASARAAHKKQK